jgi:imidazoleglycerol-phosphate dehydratase/histidinol-phosphatase
MQMKKKYLFIDRDGTIISEPKDKQIDCLSKFKLEKDVVTSLQKLQQAGYELVMVSNQDGLGTASFPQSDFEPIQKLLLEILSSQGINFSDVLICPHFEQDNCLCRKPNIGLVLNYLKSGGMDLGNSYVIGDRQTDIMLAENMGIKHIFYDKNFNWQDIADSLLRKQRSAVIERNTNETQVKIALNLDKADPINIKTNIGFFDHMLEQLAKHGGFSLELCTDGDLHVDEHHTVEDTGIALGMAFREALGDKLGINRYGFLLPMDESSAKVSLDLGGRAYFVFDGQFPREVVGELSTEMVEHFFRSLSESLKATLHIEVYGKNTHHMVESMFKAVGRSLRQAVQRNGFELPTTKGIL